MKNNRSLRSAMLRCIACASLTLTLTLPASAQTALEGKQLGALAPENLKKQRAKAPFDLTGTWNMIIDPATGRHRFDPMPKLTPAAQAQVDKRLAYEKKGLDYRDDPGACWPLGMPRMMTRFWPIQVIQLPTMIVLTTMFDHSVRWIFTDGRAHPSDDELVYTYNGHSIGHFEGDTLVVDTVGLADSHHWIQEGVPASTKLHIVERIRLLDGGKTFEDTFIMTDPENWEGEWKNTKRFKREDMTDIEEHVCIYEEVSKYPSFRLNIRE